jgi:plastocyanin
MAGKQILLALLALFVCAAQAHAATLDILVVDTNGRPAANAVVSLQPPDGAAMPPARLPAEGVIDQRNETFLPLVTILRTGGSIVFTNNDTTMHQVYSFSPIKQFAFEIDQGHKSEPVVFDKPGVASIGCNIHDQMITYVFVASTPWAVLSDAKGRVKFADIPHGSYRAIVWHPQLVPGRAAPSTTVAVNGDMKLSLTVPLLSVAPAKHMHMGTY